MSAAELVLRLFLQLVIILGASRLLGIVVRHLGQTPAVGEMIAGIVLGPSLFGVVAPGLQQWLFPQAASIAAGGETVRILHPSMAVLYAMSQLGLALYMFLVGLDFEVDVVRTRLRSVGAISVAGIAAPFLLGVALALHLRHYPGFFAAAGPAWHAALFTGAALSITAFPMLARIIQEQGITNTHVGTIALAAGSLNDAIAWVLLALLLAGLNAQPSIAVVAVAGGAAFAALMGTAGRRLLRRLAAWTERDNGVSASTLLMVLLVLIASSAFTDYVGLHAVGGAFIAGVVMPRGRFAREVRLQMEHLTLTLLVPLFFVYSGLNTRIALVNTPWLWGLTAGVTACAVAGKVGACMLAAWATGERWSDAAAIGSLMNARGLMELIILNIGLQAGVIGPTFFTIMVLMAVTTTLMTSPLFRAVYRHARGAEASVPVGLTG